MMMQQSHSRNLGDTSQGSCLIACEILWDCFPYGNYLGGATTNVAYHLNHQPATPVIVASVGKDELGREAIEQISNGWGCGINHIKVLDDLPTGKVEVHLDESGDATYVIETPAAWDYITLVNLQDPEIEKADAFLYGSVSLRSEYNRKQVDLFLKDYDGLKLFDVNLRPPHNSEEMVLEYAKKADFVKLNEEELNILSHLYSSEEELQKQILNMSDMMNVEMLCVTRADKSAMMLYYGEIFEGETFPVSVEDTVGAGDAFFASMISSLLSEDFNPKEALNKATRLGSWVATQKGAQPDYNRYDDYKNWK